MLDALIDLADAATRFGTEVAASIVMTGRQAASMGTGPRSGWSPAFLLGRVAPGKAVSGTLDIANTGMEPFEGIQFRCNGLGGGGNDRIADSQIDISPRQLDVQSGWAVPVTVTVRVPATARLGGYTGVVEVVGWPELNALVSLEVV
jgi:hypothetical protein